MSELEVYRPRELVMQGRHNETIYLKPEADRHINWIKRKRCLAMAEYCRSEMYTECTWHGNEQREEWFTKWERRWRELAEKYKEAK